MVPGSIIAMDRGYIDLKWFHSINDSGLFFITRAKKNMNYEVVERRQKQKNKGIIKDHVIKLCGFYMKKDYPGKLRLVKYKDVETGKVYEYLTNNFKLCSRTIADCYKERWQIELFFKWVKESGGTAVRGATFKSVAKLISKKYGFKETYIMVEKRL